MQRLTFTIGLAVLLGSSVAAEAGWPHAGVTGQGFYQSGPSGAPAYGSPFVPGAPPLILQAGPWYLYWPYEAHFQTPAPVNAPFLPPQMYGAYAPQSFFPGYAQGQRNMAYPAADMTSAGGPAGGSAPPMTIPPNQLPSLPGGAAPLGQ